MRSSIVSERIDEAKRPGFQTGSTGTVNGIRPSQALPTDSHIWRRIDLVIMPIATVIYFLAFLDRANIGNARIAGLQEELQMSNTQYSWSLTATYIPYVIVEVPSNLILQRLGPNIMLPLMCVLWGAAAALQGLVRDYAGLVACRFFLGLFEGGLLPGLTLYLASFYPRHKLHLRISIYFAATSLTGAFSGLLAVAILKMDGIGGRPGWSWIFILEGVFTFIFGILCFFIMPRSPTEIKGMTASQNNYIDTTLREDGIKMSDDDQFNWIEVLRSFKSPHVLLLSIAGFFNGSTLGGLAYFAPSIIEGLGYAGNRAQFMSVPPFAVTFILSVASAYVADLYSCRGVMTLIFSLLNVAGFSLFLATTSIRIRYGSLFLLFPGTYCAAPALGAWTANNSAPYIRRATALALLTTMTNAGGILSTWLLADPDPIPAVIVFLVFSVGIVVCASLNMAYLTVQNRRKAEVELLVGDKVIFDDDLGDRHARFKYVL